jgi:hypothetical protein
MKSGDKSKVPGLVAGQVEKKLNHKMSQYAGPRVRCKVCGDVVQSMYRHDFKWCKGKHIAVDGGSAYLKLTGQPKDYEVLDWQGMSEAENTPRGYASHDDFTKGKKSGT